ncbi:unnamed protein product, partial [Leptidea sinapis]
MKRFNIPLILTILVEFGAGLRVFETNGTETILAFENEVVKIICKSDFPMRYCGFVDPNGNRFSFTDLAVHDGQCVHEIKATATDGGEWRCHIGRKTQRIEIIKKIQVRIVNQLAAIQPNVTTKLGKTVTLFCATTGGYKPLSYCRPLLKKYYFPLNRSLDRGDCAVTIYSVKEEDAGLWTCGAGMDDGNEHIDSIDLDIAGLYTMSTASATGVTLGGIIIAVTLGLLGYVAWKRYRLLGVIPPDPQGIELEERQLPYSPTAPRAVPAVL